MEDQSSREYILELAREIGMVVFSSGNLDTSLGHLLTECLYLSPTQERALMRPLGTRAKIDTLLRLSKFAFDKAAQRKLVSSWCNRAKAKMDERNTVIHGTPGIYDGKIKLHLYSSSNAFEGKNEEWPKERVSGLFHAIVDLKRELETEIRPEFAVWIQAARKFHAEHWSGPQTPPVKSA